MLLRSTFLPLQVDMEIDFCPRWILAKLHIPEQSQYHVGLLVSALLILLFLPLAIRIPHFCLMQRVLGIPCPGCGVCRSILAILRLKPGIAWRANPAGIGVASVFGFQLAARPIALMAPRTGSFVSQASRNISNATLGSLLLVWVYAFGGYAMLNFLLFMTKAPPGDGGANPPAVVWRGFSGHWMAFYTAALAILYSAARREIGCVHPRNDATFPSDPQITNQGNNLEGKSVALRLKIGLLNIEDIAAWMANGKAQPLLWSQGELATGSLQ